MTNLTANTFSSPYDRTKWLSLLDSQVGITQFSSPTTIDSDIVNSFYQLGSITTSDSKTLSIYEIEVGKSTNLERNRVGMRELVAKQCGTTTNDGALAVYFNKGGGSKQWRFSFISIEYRVDEKGTQTNQTASKRYTYLLGRNAQIKTAQSRFNLLTKKPSLDKIKESFAVEPVTKEFFEELFDWYDTAQKTVIFPNDLEENKKDHTKISLIRLLTRLLFVWFIKEKKLVSSDLFRKDKLQDIIDWDKPSSFYKAILQNLFFATLNREKDYRNNESSDCSLDTKGYQYLEESKNPLFTVPYESVVNTFKDIPFLNGGLFECLDRHLTKEEAQTLKRADDSIARIDGFTDTCNNLVVPNDLFFNHKETGLIQILERFQFTTRESTNFDIDVALDPELLGKVFENLLATYDTDTGKRVTEQARKKTGSFYTPREIVSLMVDESLKEYFINQLTNKNSSIDREKVKHSVDKLFLASDGLKQLNNHDNLKLSHLVDVISEIKVLDPAVGSGAFPMGVLQRLVSLLSVLDPENERWKQRQLQKIDELDDDKTKAASKEELEKIFSSANSFNNYGRKLYLIKNCIHGVDIQPIAIHISKLRFFISLVVDQEERIEKKGNLGIQPLPNLETKLISADSLAGLSTLIKFNGKKTYENHGDILYINDITPVLNRLEVVRSNYFSANTSVAKTELRVADKKLRDKIKELLTNNDLVANNFANKIASWDIYNQNVVASWFHPTWMFGVKNGFDIVIGNPPYRQVSRRKRKYSYIEFPYSEGNDKGKQNLYKLFVEHSYNLCKQGGIATLIVQSSLMCDKSASQTRDLLLTKTKIKNLIEFPKKSSDGKNQVFKTVTQGTCILHFSKIEPDNDYSFNISIGNDISTINKLQFTEIKKSEIRKLWPIYLYFPLIKNKYLSIINKINNSDLSKPLEDYVVIFKQGDINLTSDKKSFSMNPTDAILLRGKHISRYNINYGANEFFHINDQKHQSYVIENSKSNILITQQVTGTTDPRRLIVALVKKADKDMIFGNTVNKIILTNQSDGGPFQAILNSKFMDWVFRLTSTNNHIQHYELKKLPIPQMSSDNKHQLRKYGYEFMNKKEKGEDTTQLDREIDNFVYKLFKLKEEEINTIEKEYSNATVSSKN